MATADLSMRIRLSTAFLFIVGALVVTPLFLVLVLLHRTDISKQLVLQERIEQLYSKLRNTELLEKERHLEILSIRRNIGMAVTGNDMSKNTSVHFGRGTLWKDTPELVDRFGIDLQLPTLHHYLPHMKNTIDTLQPTLKISSGRTGVSIVFGVPSVRRDHHDYLMSTLQNLVENMSIEEKNDSLIVVYIGETDLDFIKAQTDEIENRFGEHVTSGLLEVISPPATYYPDLNKLRQTLGDPMDRVRWRTKQNLDFAYLMMYCQPKGTFYVQLEDDILTKNGYVTTMRDYALRQSTINKDWLVLDFCQLGFIGKMFKCVDLSKLVAFLTMFHNDKPVDWLLDHLVHTKVCRFDKDPKECKKQKSVVWLHYRPSLFQHIGTHSSLKGKVQKLKDRHFGPLRHPYHNNPPAHVLSTVKAYKDHNLQRAYRGETFFWGLFPHKDDIIAFQFTPPVQVHRYYFHNGHVEGKYFHTSVEVLPVFSYNSTELAAYKLASHGYLTVGSFPNSTSVIEGSIHSAVGPLQVLRIRFNRNSNHCFFLSEIYIEVPDQSG